jgi:hypothetical protein
MIPARTETSGNSSVTDLYDRSEAHTNYRKQAAEQVGIGFEIPQLFFLSSNLQKEKLL